MIVKGAYEGLLQAITIKMPVNDDEMLVNDGEMLVNDGEISVWSFTNFTIINVINEHFTSISLM